jgi:hypothetical protein
LVKVTVCAALLLPTDCSAKFNAADDNEIAGWGLAVPVPLRGTVAGLAAALCAIDSVAVRAPAAVGANVSCNLQFAPALITVPAAQVEPAAIKNSAALAPETLRVFTVNGRPPVLATVSACANDTVLTVCVKLSVAGDTLAAAGRGLPVPDNVTVELLPDALCAIVKAALRVPAAVGVNVNWMEQLPPAATLVPAAHVPARANSALAAPPSVNADKVNTAVPVFLTVTVCAGLDVPIVCEANVRLAVDSEIAGDPDPAAGLAM